MRRRRRRIPQFNQGNRGLSLEWGSVWCRGDSELLGASVAASQPHTEVGPASFGALALSQAPGPGPCQGVTVSLSSLAVRPGLRLRPMPPPGVTANTPDPPVLRCCTTDFEFELMIEWRSRLVVVFSFVSCGRSGTRGTS